MRRGAHKPGKSDRAIGALVLLLPFLAAQLAWLPLGAIGGMSREVAVWSACGQALCDCLPDPVCALCPETGRSDGGPDACEVTAVASAAEQRTDSSESRELQLELVSLLTGLVGVPAGSGDAICGDRVVRREGVVAVAAVPGSRALDPETPPPWA